MPTKSSRLQTRGVSNFESYPVVQVLPAMADPPDSDDADALRVALRESEESLSAFKAKTKNYVQKLKDQVTSLLY